MNKKTKWGIIILIGAGIIGGGIYSQLPKTNDELAAADKVKNTQWKKDSERQRQSDKASTINRRIHHYRRTSAG